MAWEKGVEMASGMVWGMALDEALAMVLSFCCPTEMVSELALDEVPVLGFSSCCPIQELGVEMALEKAWDVVSEQVLVSVLATTGSSTNPPNHYPL
jgi:hypothetical protein